MHQTNSTLQQQPAGSLSESTSSSGGTPMSHGRGLKTFLALALIGLLVFYIVVSVTIGQTLSQQIISLENRVSVATSRRDALASQQTALLSIKSSLDSQVALEQQKTQLLSQKAQLQTPDTTTAAQLAAQQAAQQQALAQAQAQLDAINQQQQLAAQQAAAQAAIQTPVPQPVFSPPVRSRAS